MNKRLLLSFMAFAAMSVAETLSLRDTADACVVAVDGIEYTLNKKPIPNWGRSNLLTIGTAADGNGYGALVNLEDEGQLLPDSTTGKGTFSILEHNDQNIRIRTSFPLSKVGQNGKTTSSAELVNYYSFASGMPGTVVESRVHCLTDKIRVTLFSGSFSKDFDCYYDKDGKRTEYGKGNWANVGFKEFTGEKANGKYFFYPAIGRLPGRGVTTHVCAQWTEKTLELGECVSMKNVLGKVDSHTAGDRLVAFRNAVANPDEKALEAVQGNATMGMTAFHVNKPIKIGKFDCWEGVPLTVERNRANDYRPAEANSWKGPQDLSFKVWTAFDKDNFYLRVNVRDDQVIQNEVGTGIWAGDCIQIAFDPLCEKSLTANQILLGVAPIPKVTLCAWSHSNRDYLKPNLLDDVPCAARVVEGGYECEIAFPWKFLEPFELVRGKFGFNVVVLDGANRWMGITDGIAGGKAPSLFQDLYFHGMEDSLFSAQEQPKPELLLSSNILPMNKKVQFNAYVYAKDKDLPADLCIDFPGGGKITRKLANGFNSFPCTFLPGELKRGPGKASVYLSKNGQKLYNRDYDIILADVAYVKETAAAINDKAAVLEALVKEVEAKSGKFPFYVSSRAWIAKYYASRSIMLTNYGDSSSKEKLYYSTLSRSIRNLNYCKPMLETAIAEAKEMLAGKRAVREVPVPPKGKRPMETGDGGFAIGDQEYLFVGGNTWGLRQEDYLDYIAGSGLNFFNMFNLGNQPEPWEKMTEHAENLSLFFNRRTCMQKYGKGNYYYLDELRNAKFVSISDSSPETYKNTGTPWEPSPNLLYVIGCEESFGVPVMTGNVNFTQDDLTAKYEEQLTEYLTKKFGTIEKLNEMTGSSYASFQDAIKFGKGLKCSALKYEHFQCFEPKVMSTGKECMEHLRRVWKRPVSTHYSSLNFGTYDTLAGIGDFNAHWEAVDLPAFDGGLGCDHKEFAMNISGSSSMLIDMARSLYPERTAVNNEEYLMSCSNPSAEPPEIYHYTSTFYPALHGRTATSIFVFDNTFTSRWGELTFRRAEGFYQTARATLDLRRFANQIAPFRNLPGKTAILYTMPAYLDKKYATRMTLAWEGMTFSGLPVKFITDKQLKEGNANDLRIITVNAKHLDDTTFDALMAFADKGGIILCQGEDAMFFNDYGMKVPARAERLQKRVTRIAADSARAWFDGYEAALKTANIAPELQVLGPDGRHVYGVEYRCAKDKNGKPIMYIVNANKNASLVQLPKGRSWTDLLTGRTLDGTVTVNSLEILLLN